MDFSLIPGVRTLHLPKYVSSHRSDATCFTNDSQPGCVCVFLADVGQQERQRQAPEQLLKAEVVAAKVRNRIHVVRHVANEFGTRASLEVSGQAEVAHGR
jgi:hypothetical protein